MPSKNPRAAKRRKGEQPQSPPPAATPAPDITPTELMSAPPAQLTERERLFVEHILTRLDIPKLLAMEPGPRSIFERWTEEECERLMASPHIQCEIQRRRQLQELFNAEQEAKAMRLTPDFVKASLVDAIEGEREGPRVRAIDLGLAVTGVLENGTAPAPPNPAAPTIYRALQTRTVQRVTETVTETKEISAAVPDRPALPAPAETVEVEILDY